MVQQKVFPILQQLKKHYPNANTALIHKNPLQLLIATILSAQCTDVRVNKVTKELFKKFKTVQDFALVNQKELEKVIFSTGFYKNKAKNIIAAAKAIQQKFKGKVPLTMHELITLPGVGRKTANVVISHITGENAGIVVDTHVSRLSQRIGFSKQTSPEKIEQDLMKLFPVKEWGYISNALILHGRALCMARKPNCKECFLSKKCKSAFKF